MQLVGYPVNIETDDNATRISFPNFPEVTKRTSNGEGETLTLALKALEEAIIDRVSHKEALPDPFPANGKQVIYPSFKISVKVLLYKEMKRKNITKAELARRLDWKYPQVVRLLDMNHNSHFSQLEAAFNVLGKQIIIGAQE